MKNLIFILALLICSCSASRKTEKSSSKKEVKTEIAETKKTEVIDKSEENVIKTETTKVDQETNTITKKTVLKPINPNNPASYIDEKGNKQELNNTEKTTIETTAKEKTKSETSKDSISQFKKDIVDKSEEDFNLKFDERQIENDKKTQSNNIWIWLIIAGIIIIVILIYIRNNKK
jgi:hypothetical protein